MHKHAHFYLIAGLATAGLLAVMTPQQADARGRCEGDGFGRGNFNRQQAMNRWMNQNRFNNFNNRVNNFNNRVNAFNPNLNGNFFQQKQALKAERKRIRDLQRAGLISPQQKAAFDRQLRDAHRSFMAQYRGQNLNNGFGFNNGFGLNNALGFNGYGYNNGILGNLLGNNVTGFLPYGNSYLPYGGALPAGYDIYDTYNNPGFLSYLQGANPGLLGQLRNFIGI